MIDPISAALATVAAKEITSAIIKPIFNLAFQGSKKLTENVRDIFANKFADYVGRQIDRHSHLNTLVFQNPMSLEELYLPLTLSPSMKNSDMKEILVNKFPEKLLQETKRILITDTAGMGKSTLMKYMLIHCIRSNFSVPIFVELRHLSRARTLKVLLEEELNGLDSDNDHKFEQDDLNSVLKKGQFVFFLDGYDEISFVDREEVTKSIKTFIDSFPNNYFIITSRPETALVSFSSFEKYHIRPLKKAESFELIRRYDRNGQRAETLIARLMGKELRSVHEFLVNPLLTTLLYRCFEYKQSLPEKKHVFYRQVFDALYDWHDASKDGYNTREKKSKLDLDSFHRVLKVMGFISTMSGEIEGDKDKVLKWINDAKNLCYGLTFSENAFLEDITQAVPVFARDGLAYKWAHKSLAEYFAAQYICTEGKYQQEDIFKHITQVFQIAKFVNVLDQIYDVDQAAFRKYISLPFARSFIIHREHSYKNMSPLIPAEELELRRSITFGSSYFLARDVNVASNNSPAVEPYVVASVDDDTDLQHQRISIAKISNLKGSIFVIKVLTTNGIIGAILKSKRDPLVRAANIADNTKKPIAIYGLKTKKTIKIDDRTDDITNNNRNFSNITRLLIREMEPTSVSFENCQAFCNSFDDDQSRTSFTEKIMAITKEANK
ncbi:NACHT domain-containing protein [Undibacterium pigrum]|uniref:NACHT domain-containing protein n=1 Tax=Undibacterium pigrum TaxID=401470 RepID=A0A318J6P2_9BURK|nr:NACHT domain-containing protein [Undibacterium pigrum]PXX35249.1 NACHT domain-containing protein [Undibacterium pigrum]